MVAGRIALVQAFEVILVVHARIADDEAAVLADDVGGYQGVLLVRAQHGADVVYGDGGHQGHACLAVFHGIVRADAQDDHLGAQGIIAHGYLFLAAQEGLPERIRIRKLDGVPVQHLHFPVLGIQGQVIEVPDAGPVDQLLVQLVPVGHI